MTINFLSASIVSGVTPTAWDFLLSANDYNSFQTAFYNAPGGVYGINISLQTANGNSVTIPYNEWTLIPNTYIFQVQNAASLGINITDVVSVTYTVVTTPTTPTTPTTQNTNSIESEPGSATSLKIMAAYRPIVFQFSAANNPPVVYCDIYFNSVYYKTISKTITNAAGYYQFDIQDAAQEYLKAILAPNGQSNVVVPSQFFTQCFCKFRVSSFDTNGFIAPETPVPIQATGTQVAVSGGGIQSNLFYILNSSLQHENNQSLATHLSYYKNGVWDANVFPATHRPNKYKVYMSDSDYYPLITCMDITQLNIEVRYKDGTTDNLTSGITGGTYYNNNNPIGCQII